MDPWAVTKKNFMLVWQCHQFLSRFLANGLSFGVSYQSHLSANNDNVVKLRVVHKSPGIYLMAEENLRARSLMMAV